MLKRFVNDSVAWRGDVEGRRGREREREERGNEEGEGGGKLEQGRRLAKASRVNGCIKFRCSGAEKCDL